MSEHEEDCMCGAETESGKTKKPISVLSQSIYDKSVLSPAELSKIAKASSSALPKGIVSKCNGTQPFKLEDMEVEKVLVEYRLKPTKKEKEKVKEESQKKKREGYFFCGYF
jgi:hypothetical protein